MGRGRVTRVLRSASEASEKMSDFILCSLVSHALDISTLYILILLLLCFLCLEAFVAVLLKVLLYNGCIYDS